MREKVQILKSEIKTDIEKIERLVNRFKEAYGSFNKTHEYSKLVESAFYANQIYSGFERLLKNIADVFENSVSMDSWHKSLIERMTINVEGIRPAVISIESFKALNELRAFRHFFRHAYDTDIDEKKFAIVAENVFKLEEQYREDFSKFIKFLDNLLKEE